MWASGPLERSTVVSACRTQSRETNYSPLFVFHSPGSLDKNMHPNRCNTHKTAISVSSEAALLYIALLTTGEAIGRGNDSSE